MSSGQVESVAGFVLLAIVVMVLGYLLPAAIRSRQVVADARIDDRYSTGLRVLARAGATPPRVESTARVYLHSRSPAASSPAPTSTEPEAPMDRQLPPPASRSATQARREAAQRAARAAAASRRAAAARRRRVLLLSLLLLTAAGWALFATMTIPIAAPIAASVLLVAATVAGRRAAVRAARAEAREQPADARPRRQVDGPQAGNQREEPTTTRTGPVPVRHARRTSAGDVGGTAPAGDQDAGDGDQGGHSDLGRGTDAPAATPPTRTPISERTGSLRISVDPAAIDASHTEEGWTPVPVPVPTYALKEPAPRRTVPAYEAPKWEPAPAPAEAPADAEQERSVTLAEVEQAVRERHDAQAAPATEEQVLAEEEVARTGAAAADEAHDHTASGPAAAAGEPKRPTMDLQSVLERRRAVGQ